MPAGAQAYQQLLRNIAQIALVGRPSRRAVSAAVKLCGRRLERKWPFFPKADFGDLNLGFDDLLEFQYARSRNFNALIVGAYDGIENDPSSLFLRSHDCKAIFVEPQPGPCERLRNHMGGRSSVEIVNAAIDQQSGSRDLYCIRPRVGELPQWVEQLASFQKEHLLKHEEVVPGLTAHIEIQVVNTISFDSLLDAYLLDAIDLLQIDTEGMDAQLLAWFPFERIKPALLHYEVAHMSSAERVSTSRRLAELGYSIYPSDSPTDQMAVLF